jgi:hypothetical protein
MAGDFITGDLFLNKTIERLVVQRTNNVITYFRRAAIRIGAEIAV